MTCSVGVTTIYLAVPRPKALGSGASGLQVLKLLLRCAGHSLAMRLPERQTSASPNRRLEIGGVCGHREGDRVTQSAREGGREAPHAHGARQEVVVMDRTGHAIDTKPGTPQSGACDAKAGKSPGGAWSIPAQDSTSSNRCGKDVANVGEATVAQIVANPIARQSSGQQQHRPRRSTLYQGPRARSGIAFNDRNKMRIKSTTRSTSGIRWFLRSILEPVDYSQYTMPQHSQRIAGSTSIQWLSSLSKKVHESLFYRMRCKLQLETGPAVKPFQSTV